MKYKRVVVSKFGGPKNLHLIEEEIPEPRGHEVRVKILTAGVSLADILMREGIHPETLFRQTPFTLGWDIVGTVDKIGEKLSATSTWQIGDIRGGLANSWRIRSISVCSLYPARISSFWSGLRRSS